MSKVTEFINSLRTVPDLDSSKQDTLESGVNIKTVNGVSIIGSGDITIDTVSLAQLQATALYF